MIVLPRRKFLTGLAALVAAPAIVKASSLMPVKSYGLNLLTLEDYANYILKPQLDVLYGQINMYEAVFIRNYNLNDEVCITPIMPHEMYKNG